MTSAASAIEKLKGTWDYVDGENFDEYLKEMGISWAIRQTAKAVKKEKMIISVNDNGRWILKSESTFKNTVYEFTPGIEFNETRADGEEVKSIITFDNNTGRWIHEATDKQGRKVHIERYVDDKDQQQVELTCGNVKAHRRCLQSAHTRNDGICSYLYVTCSELNACAVDNQICLEPEHECVTHRRCHNAPLCYLMNMATETVCSPISTTTTGGNYGSNLDQLMAPHGMFVDYDDAIYIADGANQRVVKWIPGATTGQVVAGGNGKDANHGETIVDDILCYGLALDNEGSLYISDQVYNSIVKWPAGGNEQGPAKNQLIAPQSVVVNDSSTVYVVDYGNDRVTRWSEGSTSGNIILGQPGWGDDTSYISRSTDLVFNRHRNLYVLDNMNVRIPKFTIDKSACSAVSTSIKSYITVT
ncbi:unnamed protein product [Rotaria sordida]|uniref:Lipocalin/cytosolic fatty-acid binding domain-containing protein n=1 Tax=Rotaria sordida TaxID=392033 RepID=A0A818W9Q1_9BILA|nr:unnamed protein product [Rotaria sordida]